MKIVLPVRVPSPIDTSDVKPNSTRRPLGPDAVAGIIDNSKLDANRVLAAIADELARRGVIGDYFVLQKPTAALPMNPEVHVELLARADVVIAGVGDCGACTACSVHDAIRCEESGIPATVVITSGFTKIAAGVARSLGHSDYHFTTIEHPMWGRADGWYEDQADACLATVISQISADLREKVGLL